MLVARINKETTDVSRVIVPLDEFWLDESEVITAIYQATIQQGTTGWALQPYPPPGSPPPYDPTPLTFLSYTLDAANRQLIMFVQFGTPGLVYTVQFVVGGTSARRLTIEIGVQIVGQPPKDQTPLPQPPPQMGQADWYVPITGTQMTGPLYAYADPTYPTELADKNYVDTVAGATGGPFLRLAGGDMNGPLFLFRDPQGPMEAVTKEYLDNYVGTTGWLPISGGTMTGMLTLVGDPLGALDAVPKRYIDGSLANYLMLSGGQMTGPLVLSGDPVHPLDAVTLEYLQAQIAAVGGFPDAPSDGATYGRRGSDATWQAVLPLAGGAMTGDLQLSTSVTLTPSSAVSKSYVDSLMSSSGGPPHATTLPLMDSVATIGVSNQYADAAHIHPTDTSRAAASALGNYLLLSGGTMTGKLTLASDPSANLDAVTLQYLNSRLSSQGNFVEAPIDGRTYGRRGADASWQPISTGGTAGVTSFNTRTGAVTLAISDVAPLADPRYTLKAGDTMTGTLRVSNGRIISQGAGNPSLVTYAGSYAGGIWTTDSNGNLNFGWTDGNGVPTDPVFYASRDKTITTGGSLSVAGNISTPNNITASNDITAAHYYCSSNLGTMYSALSPHWIAFGWNGNLNVYVDGALQYDAASTTWVANGFKPINAYTPNQNVDYNGSPTFWDVRFNGTVSVNLFHTDQSVYLGGWGVIYTSLHASNAFGFYDAGGGYIYGTMNGSPVGSLTPASTAAVKEDIVPSTYDCLNAVLRTPLFSYRYSDSEVVKPVGFVAEDQHQVYPESVLLHEGAPWSIDLMTMVATLVGAVQQLSARLETLGRA